MAVRVTTATSTGALALTGTGALTAEGVQWPSAYTAASETAG
jgi:hypothetical protein